MKRGTLETEKYNRRQDHYADSLSFSSSFSPSIVVHGGCHSLQRFATAKLLEAGLFALGEVLTGVDMMSVETSYANRSDPPNFYEHSPLRPVEIAELRDGPDGIYEFRCSGKR